MLTTSQRSEQHRANRVSHSHQRKPRLGQELARLGEAPRARHQIMVARPGRDALAVRCRHVAARLGKPRQERQMALRIAATTDGEQHGTGRLRRAQQDYFESCVTVLQRDARHSGTCSIKKLS
jgi:hypothetical protein